MTFEEAKKAKEARPTSIKNEITMYAHVVPELKQDFIKYTGDKKDYQLNDEFAKEFSTNGQFSLYYRQKD